MLPPDIFNGEEWVIEPPQEALDIAHSFSEESDLLSFETPRLELEYYETDMSGRHADEWLWFFILTSLRDAASILFGCGLNGHEERSRDETERHFYLSSVVGKGKV